MLPTGILTYNAAQVGRPASRVIVIFEISMTTHANVAFFIDISKITTKFEVALEFGSKYVRQNKEEPNIFPMRVRTLLNRCYKLKSFVYESERFEEIDGQDCLVVDIVARKNGKPICSGCNRPGSLYDHQPQARYFEFIPVWGITIFFWYLMRRVNCKHCGVKVESVLWCDGKHHLTTVYRIFLARWARRMSWKEVSDVFNTSWDKVYRSVRYVVEYGL